MKTKIVIISLLLLCFGVRLMAGGDNISYVKTGSKVYFGNDLKMGLFKTKIKADDGTIYLVHNRDIVAFMRNEKLFELMPVISESNKTVGHAMMQYVASRSGLKLYSYNCYEQGCQKSVYTVFKDGKLYLKVNEENAAAILPFFGVKLL